MNIAIYKHSARQVLRVIERPRLQYLVLQLSNLQQCGPCCSAANKMSPTITGVEASDQS